MVAKTTVESSIFLILNCPILRIKKLRLVLYFTKLATFEVIPRPVFNLDGI